MSDRTNAAQKGAGEAAALPVPAFVGFQWVYPKGLPEGFFTNANVLEFLGITRDIAAGAKVIFELIEANGHASLSDESPILGAWDAGALHRMGISALTLLVDKATQYQDDALNNQVKTIASASGGKA